VKGIGSETKPSDVLMLTLKEIHSNHNQVNYSREEFKIWFSHY
jgi:hypothetical protein